MSSLLLFGGTFDPPHRAHAELPPLVAQQLGDDRVVYLPTSSNPLKDEQPTPAGHRLAMLELALSNVPNAEIWTYELEREGPSYTVDTLRELRRRIDDDTIVHLLMGADVALGFQRWREPEAILELVTPVVMLRPPWDADGFRLALTDAGVDGATIESWIAWTIPSPFLDISATEVRRRLAAGESLEGLLAEPVIEYICAHRLYGVRGSAQTTEPR